MDIAIKGKYALYYDSEFVFHIIKDPLLVIEGNRIVSLDTFDKAKRDLASHDMIGDEHQLILPGFINCHSHTPMTLFRGLADDIPLLEWLEQQKITQEKHAQWVAEQEEKKKAIQQAQAQAQAQAQTRTQTSFIPQTTIETSSSSGLQKKILTGVILVGLGGIVYELLTMKR